MNTQERESASNSRGGGGGGGGGGGDCQAERSGESVPSTSDSTNNIHPSSAPPTTTSEPTNKPTTMGPKPTNATNSGQRSSSTESEGPGRREYGKDRRPPPRQSDDDEEDDEEDDEGEEEARHSSEGSSGGGGAGAGGTGSDGSSSAVHPSLGSSSTSGSPVRRLPQMLRPPPGHATQQPSPSQQQQTPTSTPIYGGGGIAQATRSSMPHYYGGGGLGTASPRDPTSSPGGGGPLENGGGRVLAQKRRLQQQSNEYLSPSSPSLPPPHPQPQQQPLNPTARVMYETSQHHSSSNSSSTTARSGGGVGLGMNTNNHHHHNNTHANHHRAPDDDDDDDNEDPLRFETRGSHGPRDEARYETWTSKQLRKKCSHLKLRGLKNVKKHVMVEALYRYYRNQRTKTGNDGRGGNASTSNSANHMRNSSGSVTHNNNGGRAVTSMRNNSSAMYDERYGQQQHRYEHAMNASTTSSSYMTNSTGMGVRSSRPSMGSGNPSASLNPSMQPQTRRSAPLSISQPTRQSMRHSAGGSLPGGTYTSALDLEESKYDNEVRITSEDVIRLVDVILSPEFVDRLSTELSRWQFWVDVREKYISLAAMNGPSSYGAARGLTALGGDHHSPSGDRGSGGSNSGIDNTRLPITASYMRPSAKWSSMQLWEMWKELTFAYTKTCFEFTAAGVDERNYIQFCEGRPDVYYLHQRLHARPDLLHLIKSNEYIEEKCSSDAASEHTNMNAEKNAANALMGVGSPVTQSRPHKRFKRIVPAASNGGDRQPVGGSGGLTASQTYGGGGTTTPGTYSTGAGGNGVSGGMTVGTGAASGGNAGVNANAIGSEGATPPQMAASNSSGGGSSGGGGGSGGSGGGPAQYLASNGMHVGTTISPSGQQEEGSTENSETTGEEGSLEKSNSNATSDSTRREALAEQKYFGLLLQNFEAIFESLHNKKVLLAALRKDNSAPDHLIADLHDDIHVLSALKKDFRNKLHQALE